LRRKNILVTGGAGFIGSEFVRQAVAKGCMIIVVDKLTYAGDLNRLKEVEGRYSFYKEDICDKVKMKTIFKKEKPEIVVNFAAETHVDRSIQDASPFIEANVKGVQVLLDLSKKFKVKKFIHISTDEVYGEIKKGKFSEDSGLQPNSPYAASKAAADLLIRAYVRTHKIPAIILRPANNYGPWQYPEKLIPLAVSKILENKNVPVYGKGINIREWLYVGDCVEGIFSVIRKGIAGEIYNIGSGDEKKNIYVVKQIIKIANKPEKLIKFVKDRPGHDIRYFLDSSKINKELGWKKKICFSEGLRRTVEWCIVHRKWASDKKKQKEKK